jgi:eukaryotic-like serine/threonine-protein kinase
MVDPGEQGVDASAPTLATGATGTTASGATGTTENLRLRTAVDHALAETQVPAPATAKAEPPYAAGPTDETAPGDDLPTADLPGLGAVDPATYALGAEIARGGMGRVLAARDRRLRRDVAIKVLRDKGGATARFEREALITARLQHPSIVRVYDAGRLRGDPYYAMEKVRGRSLERIIAATPAARDRIALVPHVIAVAEALAYAHSEGVIHRDLKPANVMIGEFGETVVIDWGLAKDLREGEASLGARAASEPGRADADGSGSGSGGGPSASGSLTVAGAVMGTPAYMPPEQARGEPADERSDVYAIGAVLYAVLAGAAPITESGSTASAGARRGPPRARSGEDVARRIVPLRGRVPEAPDELMSIVERAMAHAPADRYATAGELAEELRRFAAGKLVASHAYSTGELVRRWVRRHRAAVAVAAAALAVVTALSVIGLRRIVRERDRADREAELATAAQRKAEDSADDLVFHQAQRALAADPSLALAWLDRLSERGLARPNVTALAEDAARRGVAFELAGPGDDLELLVTSDDGSTAYIAGDNGQVTRWSLATRTGTALGAHTGPVEALALSADGAWLASGGTDGNVHLWALATGGEQVFVGHTGTVRGVAFAPDATALATTGEDGTLRLWTLATGAPRILVTDSHSLRPVTWSRDGRAVWTGTGDGRVYSVDVASGRARSGKLHEAELRVLALSPDEQWLASGGEDGVVELLATATLKSRLLGRHADVVRDLVWAPDGKDVVSGGGDTIVRVYHLAGGTVDLLGNTTGVKDLAMAPDGRTVAAAGIDGMVRLWPIGGGDARVLAGHGGSVKAVGFLPDGATLLSASDDDSARLWPLGAPPPAPSGAPLAAWIRARTNLSVAPPL